MSPEIVFAELRRVARGEKSHVPLRVLTEHLAHYLIFLASLSDEDEAAAPNRDDSVFFLERLYALPDLRDEAAQ